MNIILNLFNYLNFDYFQNYDLFSEGLFITGYFFILFFLFTYSIFRGYKKNAFELSTNIFVLPFLITFLMVLTNFPSRITGLVFVISYFISLKYFTKFKYKKVIIIAIEIIMILTIVSSVGQFIGNILFYGLITYNFIKGEIDIRKNNKKTKN
ncbi:MAG: hypothetical protein PHP82_03055 [Candidatus ainarchaeum sp.]|nr:hypothetical protein [Candidatus ainarchaeum sp.]